MARPESLINKALLGGAVSPEDPDTDAPQGDAPEAETTDAPDLEAEVAALRDKLLRARADYDNLVKRTERDAALERERVKARVLEHFLQVYEYGRMAAQEAEREPGPLAQGVQMVVREFERLLESEGVRTVGTVGEAFDRTHHEAVAEEAVEGVAPGHVSRVVTQGYLLGERVLRYARVAVAPDDSAQRQQD